MRKLAVMGLAALLAAVPAAAAAQTDYADARDLQRLEYDLFNLDDSLAALDPAHPREAEFRARADRIRGRVSAMAEDIRNRSGAGAVRVVPRNELEALRGDIAALQRDIDAAAASRFTGVRAALPEGTQIQVRLEEPLSSERARLEDRFQATVALPVRVDGRLVIPAGTPVRGVVTGVQRAERPARGARLHLSFDSIEIDGVRYDLRSRIVSIDEDLDRSETAKRAGIGAVLGGVLGSIIGGTKGALIGLVIGGAGGVVASEGEDVELPAGTILTLELERPLELRR